MTRGSRTRPQKPMSVAPLELTVPITPSARFDVIDVRRRVADLHGDALDPYPRCLYNSFHTTAGYLDQSLAMRLEKRRRGISGYVAAFRTLFPEGAGYRHDDLHDRSELSADQRDVEPRNADSHLAFMAAGLRTCVTYRNRLQEPVRFVDLDGVQDGRPRQRLTSVVGYSAEVEVARARLDVPVSAHPVDSINLKDPGLGIYEQLAALIAQHGVIHGRLRLALSAGERQAGLTVNEYETLLMEHDLIEVLRDPLRFMAEKSRHALAAPRAVPSRTLDYAKYDLVRAFNEVVDALGLSESMIERILARAIGVPASRFLRMKRSVDLLVSDRTNPRLGTIVEGTYQSPILVQWRPAASRVRHVEATLYQFE
jgi:thiamine phosphate synthase YjbQ (UPF0047 family)